MPSPSKTTIANLVIAHHAGDWIEDVDSAPGRMAEAIRTLWDAALAEALAAHPWKFAKWTWRDQPALPAADNPDPDLAYAYRRPAGCARVFELRPEGWTFDQFSADLITTDAGPTVTMIGTLATVEIGRFSAFFTSYFAAHLAFRICTSVNASEAIRKRCRDERDVAFTTAISDNGRTGKVRVWRQDSWLRARRGESC